LRAAIVVGMLVLGCPALQAQKASSHFAPADRDNVQYHFQLRASRSGSGVRELAGAQVSGGGGFMAMFGDMPLRLRTRMDGDFFPASSGKQTVRTAGLGAEDVILIPALDRMDAFVSLGPAFQRWEIGSDALPATAKRSFNKAAGRLESGFWFKNRICLSLGLLWGKLEKDHSTSNPYAAITFHF